MNAKQVNGMNVKAPEFIPRHVIISNMLFDKLERKFVEEHKWIFEYEPLADVVAKEQTQRKRKFEEIEDSEEYESESEGTVGSVCETKSIDTDCIRAWVEVVKGIQTSPTN